MGQGIFPCFSNQMPIIYKSPFPILNLRCFHLRQAGTKLLCALLSLPVPSKSSSSMDQVNSARNASFPDYMEQRTVQKLLLVGYNGSGTSTIFKQVNIFQNLCIKY